MYHDNRFMKCQYCWWAGLLLKAHYLNKWLKNALRHQSCIHTNVVNRTICTSEKKKRTSGVIAGDWHYILDLNKESKQIIYNYNELLEIYPYMSKDLPSSLADQIDTSWESTMVLSNSVDFLHCRISPNGLMILETFISWLAYKSQTEEFRLARDQYFWCWLRHGQLFFWRWRVGQFSGARQLIMTSCHTTHIVPANAVSWNSTLQSCLCGL